MHIKTWVKNDTVIAIPYKRKQKLLKAIHDFSQWHRWSPWDCLDPEVKNEYSKTIGKHFHQMHWKGPVTGEGSMTVKQMREDGVDYDLTFIKPFKSRSKTSFKFFPHNGGKATLVEWTMQGNLPFFLFFMKKFIEQGVSMDFDRGLKRLRYLIESGKVPARLEFTDTLQEVSNFEFCGTSSNQVPLVNLPSTMEKGFKDIEKSLSIFKKRKEFKITGSYCFYSKINTSKLLFDYTIGHSYTGISPDDLTAKNKNFEVKTIPSHRVIKVTLTGGYDFLDDAWAGIMMHARTLKMKPLKGIPPYERYIKMGKNPNEFVTEVCYPIKFS